MATAKSRRKTSERRNLQVNQYDKIFREITEGSEGYERGEPWRSRFDEVLKEHYPV